MRRRLLIALAAVVIAVVAIALLFIQELRNNPTPLGAPSGEIAFISNREGNWDIFLLDPDGNLTNLTNDDSGVDDYFASFAFDGEVINFLAVRHEDSLGPAQVNIETGELRTFSILTGALDVLRSGRLDWDPVWYPDGERIVWASLRDFNLEVYTGNADGSNPTRLTNAGGNDWFPILSPDASEILFISDRNGGQHDVYKIDVDGENLTQLTDSEFDDIHPTWSQDGDMILYIRDIDDELEIGEMNLFLMAPDGSDQRPLGEDDVFVGDMAYSADGQQVVYMSNEEGNWHLYMMDADGSNVTRLTDGDADHMFPVWRPQPAELSDET